MEILLFHFIVYIRCWHLIKKGNKALYFMQQKVYNLKIEGFPMCTMLKILITSIFPVFIVGKQLITPGLPGPNK